MEKSNGKKTRQETVMKRFDWYIIKKFLSTFLFTLSLILVIVIVFDISEKIDEFLRSEVSLNQIFFQLLL